MRIVNVHDRTFDSDASGLAHYIDSLGSTGDRQWPSAQWPAMVMRAGLAAGSAGGHGPIRYVVEAYQPGQGVTFRFTRPRGWRGIHGFLIEDLPDRGVRLTHTLEMDASGVGLFVWLLVFQPLHDCVIEEGFDRVAADLGEPLQAPPWSRRVRLLRWLLGRLRRVRR